MLIMDGHSFETAELVVASMNGDPTATAALQATADACADSATANYLAELQAQAELWLAEREGQT